MSAKTIAVIGGGIAGASIAAELAPYASVLILEAEDQPGYHSTGRSAAFWSESYGGPLVQPLTTASGLFLRSPPAGFSDRQFSHERGALHVADAQGAEALDALEREFAGTALEFARVERAEMASILPGLRKGWDSALVERSCSDIDVAALHGAYLKSARRQGVKIVTSARVERIRRGANGSSLETSNGAYEADVIVNAAGAWAEDVAAMAGVPPVGIQPYRRTMVQLITDPQAPADMPVIMDALGRFYFRPEAGGRIWLSPHDETACAPCDCAPEEYDIALAIDRLQSLVDWRIIRVENSWAGLRSFAPDRLPVYGFAPGRSDFFWFAGQGGFGIQTAPAAAKLGAAVLLNREPEAMVAGIDPRPYRPDRFIN